MTKDIALQQAQFQEAEALVVAQQYSDAVLIYSSILNAIGADETEPTKKQLRLDALQARGNALHLCNMLRASLADYEKWCSESKPSADMVSMLIKIAQRYTQLGEQQKALLFYQEALAQPFSITPQQEASIHSGMGGVYMYLGNLLASADKHQQAVDILRLTDDKRSLANSLNGLGIAFKRQGKWDKSIACYKEALQLNKELNVVVPTAIVLNNLGEIYQKFFDLEQAYQCHQEALNLLTDDIKSRYPYLFCELYRNIGVDLYMQNKVEEAINYLQLAQHFNTVSNNPDVTMQLHISFGMAEFMRGDIAAAEEHVGQCIALAEERKARSHHANALYILGLCQHAQHELTKAEQTWQQAIYLAHETGQKMLLWEIHHTLAEHISNVEMRDVHGQIAADIRDGIVADISDESLRQIFLNGLAGQASLADG